MPIVSHLKAISEIVRNAVVDDEKRRKLMFRSLNIVLSVVALVMTVVNVFTAEYILMIATLTFSVLCIMNVLMSVANGKSESFLRKLFGVEAMALLIFFFISGIPDGFSCLWVCLIPTFALLIFGIGSGTFFSVVALAVMIFLFWTERGRSLLLYSYNATFMLRFPFLYISILMMSILIEYIRMETRNGWVRAENEYKMLYRHDALTELFNRYGMNELLEALYVDPPHRRLTVMILDIDDFKQINDRYGHNGGDAVLQFVARTLEAEVCEHCACARWGGEEFLVLMQCQHDPIQMADKLREVFESSVIPYEGQKIQITMSIGVCVANDMSKYNVNQLVNTADQCLYRSKSAGKNRVTHRYLD